MAENRPEGQVAGYLYFKCKIPTREKGEKTERQLEISHLKVGNEHRGRGLGQALFYGVLAHLEREKIEDYAKDIRLSVFNDNIAAVTLYERLGFEMYKEPWLSPMTEWVGKDPVPEIKWRRYRRYNMVTTPKNCKLIKKFMEDRMKRMRSIRPR